MVQHRPVRSEDERPWRTAADEPCILKLGRRAVMSPFYSRVAQRVTPFERIGKRHEPPEGEARCGSDLTPTSWKHLKVDQPDELRS